MTKDFTTKDFTAIRTRLEEGTANWSDVSNWVHPDRVDVGGGAVRIMQGNYGLRFKIDGSWDDLSRNTSGRWFVVCEASLFRWGTEEDRRRPKMHVHPDRVFDVPYLWGLKGRLKDHALHVSALYRSIVDECVALHPEGGRLIGQARSGQDESWVVINVGTPEARSRGEREGRYPTHWSWMRESDWGDHDLEKLADMADCHDGLVKRYMLAEFRQNRWWGRYHTIGSLIQRAIVRLLPQPYYGEQTRDARVQLPGGTVAYWKSVGRYAVAPRPDKNGGWYEHLRLDPDWEPLELNFDPEKGPVHGW